MRSSTRLSQPATTLGCTFCGRCVATSMKMPYFRPSPAISTARSVATAWIGSAGSAGQMWWASSSTTSVGTRFARRAHTVSSTPAAIAERSSGSAMLPVSTTRPSFVAIRSPITGFAGSFSHTCQWAMPSVRIRSASRRDAGVSATSAAAATSPGSNGAGSAALMSNSASSSSASATGSRRSASASAEASKFENRSRTAAVANGRSASARTICRFAAARLV